VEVEGDSAPAGRCWAPAAKAAEVEIVPSADSLR
jgi:ubiquitin